MFLPSGVEKTEKKKKKIIYESGGKIESGIKAFRASDAHTKKLFYSADDDYNDDDEK